MQKTTIFTAIHKVLLEDLNIANIDAFNEQARLNEDLYLDSVLLMQLLINLELNLGIDIPDSAFTEADFLTVNSLADFLLSQSNDATDDKISALVEPTTAKDEEFEDIKVHCFVSCLCEIIKADERVDHRPFYFGVWDADVVIDEKHHINYHSKDINHDFFKKWYQKLYGVTVLSWYEKSATKTDNINTLINFLDHKTCDQHIMVMLDMFRLPERENKFNQNPFPHYVMLENTQNPETLFMRDPDFRWEGEQNKAQVLHAISSEAVDGGYYFDSQNIRPTPNQAIYDYFNACFKANSNPMTDTVRTIINIHLNEHNTISPSNLTLALTQLPVLAIRKYAYEHGLAYFFRELNLPDEEFESWCDVIEALVSTYKKIQFRAMKIATNHKDQQFDPLLVNEIFTLLDEQDTREFQIKKRLHEVFILWAKKVNLYNQTPAIESLV